MGFYFYLTLFLISFVCEQSIGDTDCGPSVQIFWRANFNSNKIEKLAKYIHQNEKYCSPKKSLAHNATVNFYSEKNKLEVSVPIFLSRRTVDELVNSQKITLKGTAIVDTVEFQSKLSFDEKFKRSKFVRLDFDDGLILGPSEFE